MNDQSWIKTTIGAQATLQRGFDITVKEQKIGNVPVVSSSGISSFHNTAMSKGPGVVLGRKGSLGTVHYLDCDYWPHDTTLWVKDFHGNYPRFVYYFFLSLKLERLDVGSVNPTLNRNHVHPIHTLWPSPSEQRAIAHILGTLDDKIELNRKMNETLEAMSRAMFKSWFVDFHPVRSKAEGRMPAGMDAETAALFPDSFEDSELGEIPKGWRTIPLGNLVGLLNGFAFKSKDWINSGVPVVKIGSIKPGYIDLSQVSYVSEEVSANLSKFRLNTGDLLIGMTGYVGEVGLVPPAEISPLINQRVGKFVFGCNELEELSFVYFLTRNVEFKEKVVALAHGSAQANVSSASILSIRIVEPGSRLRAEFSNFATPIIKLILSNFKQSELLINVRDELLPKLLSGELRVKNAEQQVEAVL